MIGAMAILKIARMGNPVLRARAAEVADPTAPAIRALVRDMAETMVDAGGVGLAAPQVHVPLRLVIFHLPPGRTDGEAAESEDDPAGPMGPLHVLINPVITPLSAETAVGWEGCLSVPGLRGIVPRYLHIRYAAVDLAGKPVEREAHGFHARVLQHECDHLDGILYPARMTDLSLLGFNEEWDRHPVGLPGAEAPEGGDPEAVAAVAAEGAAEQDGS